MGGASNQSVGEQVGTQWRHKEDTEIIRYCEFAPNRMNTGYKLAAPQGFEPRYADPETVRLSFAVTNLLSISYLDPCSGSPANALPRYADFSQPPWWLFGRPAAMPSKNNDQAIWAGPATLFAQFEVCGP